MREMSGSLMSSWRLRTMAPSSIMDSLLKRMPSRHRIHHQPVLRRVDLGGGEVLPVALQFACVEHQGVRLGEQVGLVLGDAPFALVA